MIPLLDQNWSFSSHIWSWPSKRPTADYISSAVSLLHRVGLVHRSDRDILWGAFWPKIVLMALVRYKKFVHKNRACSNIKIKLLYRQNHVTFYRLDWITYRGISPLFQLWRPNSKDRLLVVYRFAKEWRQSLIDQWTVSSNWSGNQIKVDQGEFDPFVDIYLETDQNDPKTDQNDPKMILKGSKQSEPEIYSCIWSWPSKSAEGILQWYHSSMLFSDLSVYFGL